MAAPKRPNIAAAATARRRLGDDSAASRLRSHGWAVTPPEHAHLDWRAIADALAQRLRNHAYCDQHPAAKPEPDCPFCEDRAAYDLYLVAQAGEPRG